MLKGKTVLLGVTGSIAAYKIAGLASMLKKQHADITVLMTQNATNFINPITFETLTGNKCLIDTFDRNFQYSVEHVALAKRADIVLIAPASANVIGKIANGIADDMLTTTVMACRCPILISPAMNTNMFLNPIVQDNLAKLRRFGYTVIEPDSGYLACGDIGAGKMPSEKTLFDWIMQTIGAEKDLAGQKILVTAGATAEKIDPVRFITNHSTGKMGCALARRAAMRGADVTLVCANMTVEPPPFVTVVKAESAEDMFNAVTSRAPKMDVIIKAAAVADYRPKTVAEEKIKKHDGGMSIELERTQDILAYLGAHKPAGQFLCGFAMETENLIENARGKLGAQEPRYDRGEQPAHEGCGLCGRYERGDAADKRRNRGVADALKRRDGRPHFNKNQHTSERMNDMTQYEAAKKRYAERGVDAVAAINTLKSVPVSLHCWQGDDVRGFDGDPNAPLTGGIQTTGNYPGRARTPKELMADIDEVLRLCPGTKKLNLHASYAIFTEENGGWVDRDKLEPKHFAPWVKFCKERGLGCDFNPTYFSHPKCDPLTLSSPNRRRCKFWVEHGKACIRISQYLAEELGQPCIMNIWTGDGLKDIPADRMTPRMLYKESLDEILSEPYDFNLVKPCVESKVFGIGVEAYTVGSAEFALSYAAMNKDKCIPLLDNGHYHPDGGRIR